MFTATRFELVIIVALIVITVFLAFSVMIWS